MAMLACPENAEPVSGVRGAPHNRHRREDPRQATRLHPLSDEDRLEDALCQHAAPDRVSKHSRPSSPHCDGLLTLMDPAGSLMEERSTRPLPPQRACPQIVMVSGTPPLVLRS